MSQDLVEQEFIAQVMEHQGIAHKICYMYCDDEEGRKDLLQEIFINLWKSYSTFRGNSKFSTWMYRVSLNVALQYLRDSKKNREFVTLPDAFDEIRTSQKEELPEKEKQLMYNAIDQLSSVEKAIVMLYLEEKGNEEIAEIMGITQNYVRVKMTRIRKKLKHMVEA